MSHLNQKKTVQSRVIQGDAKEKLRSVASNSVDLLCTDHPYRYGFMGKAWDRKQDFTPIWEQCLRVMKPGAFGFIMNAPRADCQLLLLSELASVGFNIQFSPIHWCYNSGFPKAGDTSKLIDKRFGLEREVVGNYEHPGRQNRSYQATAEVFSGDRVNDKIEKTPKMTFGGEIEGGWTNSEKNLQITKPASLEAAQFEGSKVGHQMKPAFEVVTVVMKPLDQKTYIDQALSNGKGVTWIDDCRIPYSDLMEVNTKESGCYTRGIFSKEAEKNAKKGFCTPGDSGIYNWNSPEAQKLKKQMIGGRSNHTITYADEPLTGFKPQEFDDININLKGRYPANLLISDDLFGPDQSKFFSLDQWWQMKMNLSSLPKTQQQTFPFLFVPKASKGEKNKGLETQVGKKVRDGRKAHVDNAYQRGETVRKNSHPTSKPIQLMSYLITLGSRPGDLILDPFAGSGTTGIACKREDRNYIMIELMPEYYAIMKARLKAESRHRKLI
jgi:site-specific DNA-methyltransferase (adenine-specific)